MENLKDIKKFSFVIAAGGSGSRMGDKNLKKQFRLLNNRQVWRWSADLAAGLDCDSEKFKICEIVLVLPEEDFNLINIDDWNKNMKLKLVAGGNSRPESVLNGLNACNYDYVMIHDAARPFLTREIIFRLAGAVDETTGAIPVIPVSDAIKHIDEDEDKNKNITHLDRDKLFITQTPQVFYRPRLIEIIKKHGMDAKDEAEAWLDAGFKIKTVDGDRMNFKITVPADWEIARALIGGNDPLATSCPSPPCKGRLASHIRGGGEQSEPERCLTRTGLGYDIHRLVPDRKLILGGVLIEDSPLGLLGHSDADLLTHAIADAVLGGAGLPDIGNLFPASDEKYRGADSLKLLEEAVNLVNKAGWRVAWVDAVIQAQVPRLNKYLIEMKRNFYKIFKSDCVNIKAKSAELTDDAGMALSMTCWAAATLNKI